MTFGSGVLLDTGNNLLGFWESPNVGILHDSFSFHSREQSQSHRIRLSDINVHLLDLLSFVRM